MYLVEDLKNLRNGKNVTQQRKSLLQQQQQLSSKSSFGASGAGFAKLSPASHRLHSHSEQQTQQNNTLIPSRNSVDQYGDLHVRNPLIDSSHARGGIGETDSDHGGLNDEISSISSDKYERDVTVLNHCFDDIEKFIARLQHVAAASRELERRRRNRKTKRKDPGEGLLTLRTRPPYEKEFIDIFAKFKLSFNLLAKLKAHIHDPNAPELVHFLFTPLALIVEASSDTYYDSHLPARVVNPLLTREAINLLINCVTSKETELWHSLGDCWVVPRDQWKNDVGSYHPVFMDGWSPDYLVIDELETMNTPSHINKRRFEAQINLNMIHAVYSDLNGGSGVTGDNNNISHPVLHIGQTEEYETNHYEREEKLIESASLSGGLDCGPGDLSTRSEISIDSIERSGGGGGGSHGLLINNKTADNIQALSTDRQKLRARDNARASTSGRINNLMTEYSGRDNTNNNEQLVEAWLDDLQTGGAKIVLVTYPRTANNDKELSVVRGEYLEVSTNRASLSTNSTRFESVLR